MQVRTHPSPSPPPSLRAQSVLLGKSICRKRNVQLQRGPDASAITFGFTSSVGGKANTQALLGPEEAREENSPWVLRAGGTRKGPLRRPALL